MGGRLQRPPHREGASEEYLRPREGRCSDPRPGGSSPGDLLLPQVPLALLSRWMGASAKRLAEPLDRRLKQIVQLLTDLPGKLEDKFLQPGFHRVAGELDGAPIAGHLDIFSSPVRKDQDI
ncbi:hypothetical protein [Sanxia water strider virus 19]|uniref:hypothetical protein n=1 Tax=Sanxia water strider virus 19 TaxID=1923403 RepID=UPI00090C6C0B|nr:hypothetical protein [Sanxia water strider virus 19]APG76956.1 hypothetical protein [Sanxia water strider virus 19]APG76959.1 hypothetical protein [Sanxia water strider virus 19]